MHCGHRDNLIGRPNVLPPRIIIGQRDEGSEHGQNEERCSTEGASHISLLRIPYAAVREIWFIAATFLPIIAQGADP
jgi:hypothetical protein